MGRTRFIGDHHDLTDPTEYARALFLYFEGRYDYCGFAQEAADHEPARQIRMDTCAAQLLIKTRSVDVDESFEALARGYGWSIVKDLLSASSLYRSHETLIAAGSRLGHPVGWRGASILRAIDSRTGRVSKAACIEVVPRELADYGSNRGDDTYLQSVAFSKLVGSLRLAFFQIPKLAFNLKDGSHDPWVGSVTRVEPFRGYPVWELRDACGLDIPLGAASMPGALGEPVSLFEVGGDMTSGEGIYLAVDYIEVLARYIVHRPHRDGLLEALRRRVLSLAASRGLGGRDAVTWVAEKLRHFILLHEIGHVASDSYFTQAFRPLRMIVGQDPFTWIGIGPPPDPSAICRGAMEIAAEACAVEGLEREADELSVALYVLLRCYAPRRAHAEASPCLLDMCQAHITALHSIILGGGAKRMWAMVEERLRFARAHQDGQSRGPEPDSKRTLMKMCDEVFAAVCHDLGLDELRSETRAEQLSMGLLQSG